MIGVALSDVHLGKSQFSRTVDGRNARQRDIENAWFRAIDVIVERQPDLVTIAGDVFDSVRPPLHAVKAYRDGLRRVVEETQARVIVIPGNHDATKTAEALSPCVIPDDLPRVSVVTYARWVVFTTGAGESAAVLCVPHDNLGGVQHFAPGEAPTAHVHGMVIHAAVRAGPESGELPKFYGGDLAVDINQMADAFDFDFVAAGDYHEFTRLHRNRIAFYSGSIERTSSNIWPEKAPKGVVLFDTTAGTMELLPIYTRPVFDYDLADVIGYGMVPEEADRVNQALEDLAGDAEHRDAIVRLVVEDLPRDEYPLIDRKLTAELRSLCFHFQLDVRFQERELTSTARAGSSLFEEAERFFAQDPDTVKATALTYLRGAA